jgi:hypothetical protein
VLRCGVTVDVKHVHWHFPNVSGSFGGYHSIQLSYERVGRDFTTVSLPSTKRLGVSGGWGEELPKDSIVNRIEVNRALSTGVIALEQMEARLARRAQLPGNVGRS